ncbi:MAG: sugar phosphate isomerase/epimerase [Clostridia bacterium]|nr:sugar phosphate isomerase/epimerase [Clostridia bacterium]
MKIGAQLYTIHDHIKTLEDFSESLKKVADIGYTYVQVSGSCDFEAEWLAEELKKNGLVCPLTHTKYERVLGETDKVIAEHKIFGCDHIGIGGIPGLGVENVEERIAKVRGFVADAKPAVKKIADAGLLFMYHNHHREYFNKIDGKNIMEFLSDEFTPNEMGFTLDTYWAKVAGYDPLDEIKRLSGRLPCVHFKDGKLDENGEMRFTWCGDGVLDFEAMGDALIAAGTKYVFVEQDKTFPDEPDPFVCLKKSRDYLKSLGFEF